jgi:DNA ligase-1
MARMPGLMITVMLLWAASCCAAEPPALMLATRWEAGADPAGWWMSEKYDGVRGYWDGARMLTRQGEAIAIPDALRAALPDFPLDGELWAGHGRFEATMAAVRDRAPGAEWAAIRYMVFDAPGHGGPFEARLAAIEDWLRAHPSALIRAVVQSRCEGEAQLRIFLRDVENRGGEGVMLRAPGSPHVAGRSGFLRKVKSFDDAEATVLGYNPGAGKFVGVVGSLRVALPDGTRFAVGSGLSDHERRNPPPIGSVITFRHQGWTARGLPRFPVYWRVRELPPGNARRE